LTHQSGGVHPRAGFRGPQLRRLLPATVRAAVEVLNVNTVSCSGFTLPEIDTMEAKERLHPVDL
jgi:hypothetical protein